MEKITRIINSSPLITQAVTLYNLSHTLCFLCFPNLQSLYKTLDANRCKLLCHTKPQRNAMQTSPTQLCTEQLECGSSITMFMRCCTKANKPYRAAELIISAAVLDKHNYITSRFKLLRMHATVWHRRDLQAGESAYKLLARGFSHELHFMIFQGFSAPEQESKNQCLY